MMRKLSNNELQRVSTETFKASPKIPLVVVLDNIRSQNNIGSVFRTCDAFPVEEILLCGITATPPHPEIHKTALGATDSVNWRYMADTRDAIAELKSKGYHILSVEQAENSEKLGEYRLPSGQRTALIFGHEVHGVSQEVVDLSDGCLEVPQYGTKHSLNISVCAGIVIWDLFRQTSR